MTAKEIIIKYLKDNGYDGLYDDDCGCGIDDLMPCGNSPYYCNPAYRCNCDLHCGEYGGCYTPEKQNKCWKEEEPPKEGE
jgi:hypothetical protein